MNTMNTGIYAIRNTIDGKCYIGSAKSFVNRFSEHKRSLDKKKHHSIKLQRAWDKHGKENFIFEKLIICSIADLMMYEQLMMDSFNAASSGYNILPTAGSNIGKFVSEESKKKMSIAQTGRKHSAETRAKISSSNKGKSPSAYALEKARIAKLGMIITDETRAKMSASQTGRKHSEETKAKISSGNKGKIIPIEVRAKIALTNTGKKASDETKEKMSAARIGKKLGPMTDEHKRKLSESKKGIGHTHLDETKIKISNALKNRTFSDAHRLAISIAQKTRLAAAKAAQQESA